ncbi:MAG: pentapeptide repeat-containing protein [Myxococcota bacterium]
MQDFPFPHKDSSDAPRPFLSGAEFRERVEREGELRCATVEGQCLDELELNGVTLQDVHFVGCSMHRVRFDDVICIDCSFRSVNFLKSAIKDLVAIRCHFTELFLSSVHLSESQFLGGTMIGTESDEVVMHSVFFDKTDLSGLRSPQADLNMVTFSGCTLSDATFTGSCFERVTFLEADLRSAQLQQVAMDSCVLNKVNVAGVSFAGQTLRGCQWQRSVLAGCDFTKSVLDGSGFKDCDLSTALFTEASVCYSSFPESNLRQVIAESALFNRSNLAGVDFTGAVLREASFKESVLQGAKLHDVPMQNSILDYADLSWCEMTGNLNLSGASTYRTRCHAVRGLAQLPEGAIPTDQELLRAELYRPPGDAA